MLVERGLQLGLGPGVELLDEDDADGHVLALLALDAQVVADLAGADEQAARVLVTVVVGEDILEVVAAKSARGDIASGWRSMDFGVKTMSGLRHLRMAWRRSRWKYCAAVEGWQIWMLSCAASWR
jgi:hypothetical protein